MEDKRVTGSIQWRKTTCGEAKNMKEVGMLIFWRPDMILNYRDPENDVAFYAAP